MFFYFAVKIHQVGGKDVTLITQLTECRFAVDITIVLAGESIVAIAIFLAVIQLNAAREGILPDRTAHPETKKLSASVAQIDTGETFKCFRGFFGCKEDRPSSGIFTEQCTLRATQHLHRLHIQHVHEL